MTAAADLNSVIVDTEAAVLGAVLFNPAALTDTLIGSLTAASFVRPVHQQLFELIAEVCNEGGDPGALAVMQAAQRARLGHVVEYITTLTASSAGWNSTLLSEFERNVTQLSGYAYTRAVAEQGAALQALPTAADPEDVAWIRDRAREIIDAVPDRTDVDDVSWSTLFLRELERAENPQKAQTVPVPFRDLDSLLDGGLRAGEVVVVAARPAIGKTVIATEFSRHAALKGVRTVMVSLEMTEAEISARLTAATARVLLSKTKKMVEVENVLEDRDWQLLASAASKIERYGQNLTIVEPHSAFTVPNLDRRLTVMERQGDPAGLVVIDYLQLMETVGTRKAENRQVEVAQMSRALKLLAKKHGIPVVVLAQLNRGPEQRTDKKPIMADLRESGAIEQDASVVILLHREDAYDKESPRAGEMDLIVAKNRNGATGTVTVAFRGHYATAADLAMSQDGR